jgi:NAD(P)-dependent dehydrogenase (short-subunit alcohol dehydrogenase family)
MSRTSMWALLYLARSAGSALRESGSRGRLVVTSSAAGITGTPYRPLYAAVKAGQRALVKAMAREWGPAGVTVNAIAPLAATSGQLEAFERTPAVRESIEARSALGRVGTPADVAAVVAFLASDDARYLTGQTLVCDGGWFTGW